MRTDPRAACANEREAALWAAVHDLIAHPLMVLTWYSYASLLFHDWTSRRAWPRPKRFESARVQYGRTLFGPMRAEELSPGIWRVHHGRVSHAITLQAADSLEAYGKACRWFHTLSAEFGGKFAAEHMQ